LRSKNKSIMKSLPVLFFKILGHQWKEAVRSSYFQKSVLINIILGVFLLYFLANLVFLGFFMGKILVSAVPGADPVLTLSGIMLYYFMADFLLRFLLQPAPVISVMPYLHLPVRRSSIFHFLLIRSGFSLFNFFPLVVLLPFTLNYVVPTYSPGNGSAWFITLVLLIFSGNYLSFFFKKLFAQKPLVIIFAAAAIAALVWFDIWQGRPISLLFGNGLMFIALNPLWLLIPLAILGLSYGISWAYLYRQRYMEVREKHERQYSAAGRSRFSGIFGVTATLVSLETKMILRNNRPRTYLVLSILFMLYGFLVYPRQPVSGGYGVMLFIGLMMTGIMMIQYGQLVLSWESSYFDRLSTANFSTAEFFSAKFWLFFLFNTAAFIVTLPYALYDYRILFINLSSWLFNSGINIFVILFLGTYNTKRVDMSKGAFFNYEGVSAVHFIMILPVMGLPVFIYWLISLLGSPGAGILVVGLAGLAGLIFHRQLNTIVTRQFLARKQAILYGFRNG